MTSWRQLGRVWPLVALAAALACGSGASPAAPGTGSKPAGAPPATSDPPAAPPPPPAASPPRGPPARPRDSIAVALPTIAQSQLPYYIAREKGFLAEEGIEAELAVVAPNL